MRSMFPPVNIRRVCIRNARTAIRNMLYLQSLSTRANGKRNVLFDCAHKCHCRARVIKVWDVKLRYTCQNCRFRNVRPTTRLDRRIATMKNFSRKMAWVALAVSFGASSVSLQAQSVDFLPEVDPYLTLTPTVRVYFQAKDDRDGGDPTQATVGPSVQFYLKPLVKLKKIAAFDLDDSKHRPMVFEIGYRYITAPDTASKDRLLTAVTFHFPLKYSVLITDRNRADLDWKAGTFYWRYRNKLTLERTFAIHSYHLIPYVAAEPYYESQYGKWSTTSLYAGCLLPVGKHVQFNPYYEHDNNTGKHPNQQVNSIGLELNLYFSILKN